jgi:hypothetical protein
MFGFQRLDAHQAAVGFLGVASKLVSKKPRGNADECAAILDALETMAVLDEAALKNARELLERVVSMLTGLIQQ